MNIENNYLIILLFTFFINVTFLILGDIFFRILSLKRKNIFYVLLSGFFIYFLFTFLFYLPGIIFNLKTNDFVNFEIVKQIIIMFIIFFYLFFVLRFNKKFNFYNLFYLILFFIIQYFFIWIFIFSSQNLEWFNDLSKEERILNSLNHLNSFGNVNINNFSPYNNDFSNQYANYQIYYLFGLTNSRISNISIEYIFVYIFPVIIILFLTTISFTMFFEKDIKGIFFGIMLFILLFFTFGYISILNNMAMVIFVFSFLVITIYIHDGFFYKNEKPFIIPSISLFALIFSTDLSIFITLVLGVALIFYLMEKNINFSKILNIILIDLYFQIFLIYMFLGIIKLFILSIFFLPVIMIFLLRYFKDNLDNDLLQIEEWTFANRKKIYVFSIGLIISLFLFFLIKDYETISSEITNYFLIDIDWKLTNYIIFSIVSPVILLVYYYFLNDNKQTNKSPFIILPSFVLFLNPMSLSVWNQIFEIQLYNFEILLNIIILLLFIIELTHNGKKWISKNLIHWRI